MNIVKAPETSEVFFHQQRGLNLDLRKAEKAAIDLQIVNVNIILKIDNRHTMPVVGGWYPDPTGFFHYGNCVYLSSPSRSHITVNMLDSFVRGTRKRYSPYYLTSRDVCCPTTVEQAVLHTIIHEFMHHIYDDVNEKRTDARTILYLRDNVKSHPFGKSKELVSLAEGVGV